MENQIQKTENGIQKGSWTPDQVQLIKSTVAKGSTDDEFKLFLYTAQKYGFDPLIKQIWCVKYGTEPAAIFAGRDGFLSKAHESGKFDGMKTTIRVEPVPFAKKIKKKGYNGQPDTWVDFKKDTQYVATAFVFRKDMSHPIEVEVWEEEYSSGQSNWAKMPRTMIGKVAESQSLRRAFNISGIYSEGEEQAIEASTTIDINHTEVLSDEIQNQLLEAQTEDELKNIWEGNKQLHKKTFFIQAVNKRKSEIKNPVSVPDEIPEQIIMQINEAESMENLNAIYDEYSIHHHNKEFGAMINKKKIAIGKNLKKV